MITRKNKTKKLFICLDLLQIIQKLIKAQFHNNLELLKKINNFLILKLLTEV